MSGELSIDFFAKDPWFPSGIAQSFEPAADNVPEGFEAWRLHTKFSSHLFIWPSGNPNKIEWWRRAIPVGSGGKRWGDPPVFDGGKIEPLISENCPLYQLTEKSGREVIIALLPMDEKGVVRNLSELNSSHLNPAFGGIQVGKQDLILFFSKLDGTTADKLLKVAFEKGDQQEAQEICKSIGMVLGRFHCDALGSKSLPNDERQWNGRLKQLEERVQSNTLWRAPHSSSTLATITHRNFGLNSVRFIEDELSIDCSNIRVICAVFPPSRDFPALRDLASAYRSLAEICDINQIDQEQEILLRESIFEGWLLSAPKLITSHNALSSYRGGVPIWEYEQVLEEVAYSQASGNPISKRTKWWLEHVNRIQTQMYHSRTFAALSMISGVCAFFAPFSGHLIESLSDRLALSFALILSSIGFRWIYRRRAPPPY